MTYEQHLATLDEARRQAVRDYMEEARAADTSGLFTEGGFAERAGLNPTVFSGLMRGRRRWTDDMFARICVGLDISPAEALAEMAARMPDGETT